MSQSLLHCFLPADRLYDPESDMWVLPDDEVDTLLIGATAFAIHLAGKIIDFTGKPPGTRIESGEEMATMACAESVIALYAPVGFELLEGNSLLEGHPDRLLRDPYGAGWIARARPLDWRRDIGRLVDAKHYRRHIRRTEPDAVIEIA